MKRGFWSIPVIWDAATFFILGGGPSLAKVDLSKLYDKRVIAINDAYMLYQWDVMYFKDKHWYDREAARDDSRKNRDRLKEFTGLKITNVPEMEGEPGIKVVKRGDRRKLGDTPDKIMHGTNGGAEAIDVGFHLGGVRAILLGFDMKTQEKAHNWHPNHTRQIPDSIYKDQYNGCFEAIAKQLNGREIINCTEDSALTCFPTGRLEDYL